MCSGRFHACESGEAVGALVGEDAAVECMNDFSSVAVCMDLVKQQFGSASVFSVTSLTILKLETAVVPLRVFLLCFFSLSGQHGLDFSDDS